MPTSPNTARTGLLYGFAAYLIWGGLPLYFLLLSPTGPIELVAWRIVFSLALCVILLSVTRGWRSMGALLRRPRAVETAWLLPLAIAMLGLVSATSLFGTAGLVFGTQGALLTVLLIGVGAVTAVPLILFAAASRRLSLVSIGLIQFLTPIIQFILGYFVLHEAMPPARWFGFALVWIAVAVLSIDLLRQGRASRRAAPLAA